MMNYYCVRLYLELSDFSSTASPTMLKYHTVRTEYHTVYTLTFHYLNFFDFITFLLHPLYHTNF
jgi:hypothetical protein